MSQQDFTDRIKTKWHNGKLVIKTKRKWELYEVYRLKVDASIGRLAYRLTKPNGASVDVLVNEFGASCDCPDFIHRREGKDPRGCKHCRALRAWGLL